MKKSIRPNVDRVNDDRHRLFGQIPTTPLDPVSAISEA